MKQRIASKKKTKTTPVVATPRPIPGGGAALQQPEEALLPMQQQLSDEITLVGNELLVFVSAMEGVDRRGIVGTISILLDAMPRRLFDLADRIEIELVAKGAK